AAGCRPSAPPETAAQAPISDNPLLAGWTGPYGGVPPWDQVRLERFPEAFERGIALRRAEIAAITASLEPPSFENPIVALERSGEALSRVRRLFGVPSSNLSNPEVQALDREWSPRLSAASDEIVFDSALFARLE